MFVPVPPASLHLTEPVCPAGLPQLAGALAAEQGASSTQCHGTSSRPHRAPALHRKTDIQASSTNCPMSTRHRKPAAHRPPGPRGLFTPLLSTDGEKRVGIKSLPLGPLGNPFLPAPATHILSQGQSHTRTHLCLQVCYPRSGCRQPEEVRLRGDSCPTRKTLTIGTLGT